MIKKLYFSANIDEDKKFKELPAIFIMLSDTFKPEDPI